LCLSALGAASVCGGFAANEPKDPVKVRIGCWVYRKYLRSRVLHVQRAA